MREAALWATAAALACLMTAGAFLVLANLATGSLAKDLPATPSRGGSGPALDLDLNRNRLASLKPAPDQELLLTVENAGSSDFSNVNLTLESASGDTSEPRSRYYRQTLQNLKSGESVEVSFLLDLSGTTRTSNATTTTHERSEILEIRATTPEGVSVVRTAILPLYSEAHKN